MAVCGLLSMLCAFPIRPATDMDNCPRRSTGVELIHLFPLKIASDARASSCHSSTMVTSNDPDDSGSSQPTSTADSKPILPRDICFSRQGLELCISLNDSQRTPQSPNLSNPLPPAKDELDDPSGSSSPRTDLVGCEGEAETVLKFAGPPKKRARMMNSMGFKIDESQTVSACGQGQTIASLTTSSDVTDVHDPTSSILLESERQSTSGQSRAAASGSVLENSWWRTPNTSTTDFELRQLNAGVEFMGDVVSGDGRTTLPAERDYVFKKPVYHPNMLSSMENEQGKRVLSSVEHEQGKSLVVPATGGSSWLGSRCEQASSPPIHNTGDRSFLLRIDSSISRFGGGSAAKDDPIAQSANASFIDRRETNLQECGLIGHNLRHPFDVGQRMPPPSEVQRAGSEHVAVGLGRQSTQDGGSVIGHQIRRRLGVESAGVLGSRQLGDQRSLQPLPEGNANSNFYARILGAMPSDVAVAGPSSQTGFGANFNFGRGLGVPGQAPPRGSSQVGGSTSHYRETGPALGMQQANSGMLKNFITAHPVMTSPSFISPVQSMDTGPRLNFPNIGSIEFLQSLQRQSLLLGDRYVGASQVRGFGSQGVPSELNLSLPGVGGGLHAVPSSAAMHQFFSVEGSTSVLPTRDPATGVHGSGHRMELPTALSLHSPEVPSSLAVVLDGKSIGPRVVLQGYDNYGNFATAMRTMFENNVVEQEPRRAHADVCTLANAIPGYVIAYEDEEGDVLLAGDLPWREFVRGAKQIRIVSSSKISFKTSSELPSS